MLAFGIIIPVLPHLIEQLSGGGTANAAWWVGVLSTVFADHPVRVLADPGRAVRPLRPAAGDPDLQPRPGGRFHGAGAGTHAVAAVRRPHRDGHDGGQFQHGQCVHRRHHAEGKALRRLWPARRRVRRRLHPRARAGRLARRHASAAAVLRGRRAGAVQLPLWPVRAARVAAEGTAQRAVRVAQRASAGRTEAAAPHAAAARHGRGDLPGLPGALRAADHLRAVRRLPLPLGYRRRWAWC